MKKEMQFIGKKFIGGSVAAVAFIAVAGTSLWALAAFSEPSSGPAASIQDFATNVLGANNADNAFDSSLITANGDGSVVERLENLESKSLATAISSESGSSMTYAQASAYCRDLSATAETAMDGSNTSTTYTDWRLGSMTELANFVGTTSSTNYIWSATPRDADSGDWMRMRLSDGLWNGYHYNYSTDFRCVR